MTFGEHVPNNLGPFLRLRLGHVLQTDDQAEEVAQTVRFFLATQPNLTAKWLLVLREQQVAKELALKTQFQSACPSSRYDPWQFSERRYAVVREMREGGEFYALRGVYMDGDRVHGWTENPLVAQGLTHDRCRRVLKQMLRDASDEYLDITTDPPRWLPLRCPSCTHDMDDHRSDEGAPSGDASLCRAQSVPECGCRVTP